MPEKKRRSHFGLRNAFVAKTLCIDCKRIPITAALHAVRGKSHPETKLQSRVILQPRGGCPLRARRDAAGVVVHRLRFLRGGGGAVRGLGSFRRPEAACQAGGADPPAVHDE